MALFSLRGFPSHDPRVVCALHVVRALGVAVSVTNEYDLAAFQPRVFSRQPLDPAFLAFTTAWHELQFDHQLSGKLAGDVTPVLELIHSMRPRALASWSMASSFLGLPRRFLLPSK